MYLIICRIFSDDEWFDSVTRHEQAEKSHEISPLSFYKTSIFLYPIMTFVRSCQSGLNSHRNCSLLYKKKA